MAKELAGEKDFHLDPVTEASGSHPVGTGLGAAAEDAYWRDRYRSEPYYQPGRGYDDFGPAYELGWTGWMTSDGAFDVIEARLTEPSRAHVEHVEHVEHVDVVGMLNALLVACHDSAYALADCTEHTQARHLRELLKKHTDECRMAALEIRSQVKRFGGEPEEGGTPSGAFHRSWAKVRGRLTGYTDAQMLQECARAQDALLKHLQSALQASLPAELPPVLQALERHAQRGQAQIKAAREHLKKKV